MHKLQVLEQLKVRLILFPQDKKKIPTGVTSSKVLLQINGDNANIVENKSNGNDIELRSIRDNDSRAPLVATISPASPVVVVAVTAPPPSLTVNESRRKKEDNMAVIFMGFILVFLVCHLPRYALLLHSLFKTTDPKS